MKYSVPIEKITTAYRKALGREFFAVDTTDDTRKYMKQLGKNNGLVVNGVLHLGSSGREYWETISITFNSEQDYLIFLLKWS